MIDDELRTFKRDIDLIAYAFQGDRGYPRDHELAQLLALGRRLLDEDAS